MAAMASTITNAPNVDTNGRYRSNWPCWFTQRAAAVRPAAHGVAVRPRPVPADHGVAVLPPEAEREANGN